MRRTWLVFAVAVAAVAILVFLRKGEPPQLPFAKVKRETLVSSLLTNGKVEPFEWQAVRAETSGIVTEVPVKEGQTVARDELIARIAQPGAEEDLRGAQARAAQYQSDLDTLRRGGKSTQIAELDAVLAQTEFDRAQAQHDYDSLERLVSKQAATQMEVQVAKQRLDKDSLVIQNLHERLKALVSPPDIAAGRARVAEAAAEEDAAKVKLSTGSVFSPRSGTIYSLPVRPGAYVNAGDLVANIGNVDQMRVKVFVDEPELGRVHAGLPVKITWDGLPGHTWEGAVERTPTEIVPLNTRQVGEVWVTIQNQDHSLLPGTTVNAEVRTNIDRNALVIPKPALRRDRGPVGAYVLRGGRLAWQPVITGPSDISNSAIRSGLSEGDLVLLPTDAPLKEGDRARPLIQP